jgi:uncharacterized protein involved in exopolysaccharide biosynthesis
MFEIDDDREEAGKESPPPTVRELAMVLFRQRTVFSGTAAFIFLLAILYALLGTSYRSHLSVLVRRGRSDPPMTGQQNAAPDFSRVEVTEEDLNSEVELFRDNEVLRQAVQSNGLAAHDWLRRLRPNETDAARTERATRKLAKQLKIEPIKKSNLIAVDYEAADPALAASVLRSLSSAYLEKHMQVHRPAGQLLFFDRQTAESRKQLETAKQSLIDFTKSRRGAVSAEQERDLLLRRLDALEAGAGETRVQLLQAQRRAGELNAELEELPQRTTTQIHTADNPELLRALKTELLDLELKRTQLLTKFEPGHRLVREIEGQIAQSKSAIAAEKEAPLRDETTDQEKNYEWAKAELEKTRVDMKGLRARQRAIQEELSHNRALAQKLGEAAVVQEDLASSEKAAEENYLLYVKKREEARVADAMDEGGIVNVTIADAPMTPALPVWPPALVVFAGFATALAAGIGMALAADYLDPALRTPAEVLTCLDLPVLASLPGRNNRNKTRLSA